MKKKDSGPFLGTHKMRWHWMAKLVQKYQWKTGAEIGVREGMFAQHLLKHTKIEKLYCIDPWEDEPELYERFVRFYGQNERVEILRQRSEEAEIPEVDFVFIDGDHSYEAVKADIEKYLPKTRYFLAGHDYGNPKVSKAVDELLGLTKKGHDECWGYYVG